MTRLLHVADLHLSTGEEKEYSLGVLQEIIEQANALKADYLLLCGDVFDDAESVKELSEAFRKIISRFGGKTCFIPGNHEVLRGAPGGAMNEFKRSRFDPALVFTETPVSVVLLPGDPAVEILAIPHQDEYSGYRDWIAQGKVPPKKAKFRIAMAHGMLSGLGFPPPDEETAAGAMDRDVFLRHEVDYAALGHVHTLTQPIRMGGLILCYAGSARVRTKKETGPRGGVLIECTDTLTTSRVFFKKAGQYRTWDAPLNFDSTLYSPLYSDEFPPEWGPDDHVEIRFSGLVEDENPLHLLETALTERFVGKTIRRFSFSSENVIVLAGVSALPVAKRFLELCEAKKPARDHVAYPIWEKARMIGLQELKKVL
ncbi:metallophosphoesterase [Bdellovibrionota bacterium FG-2]